MSRRQRIESFLDILYNQDYKERPATINKILCSDEFFGSLTENGNAVYPIWKERLDEIHNEDSKYLIVLTGAIGCLGSGVKVSLLDGRELTIPEIIEERNQGKQHWVYSYDTKDNRVVPGKVTDALLSGRSSDTVEVELDNMEKIICTDNHPFLLITGEYKNAGDLVEGDRLSPLYRDLTKYGYELAGTTKGKWRCTHTIVAEEIYGEVKKGQCVHHKDFDKRNNAPENLRKMKYKAHQRYHSSYGNPFVRNPELCKEGGRKCCELRWQGPNNKEQRRKASERLKERNKHGQAKRACEVRWAAADAMEKRMEYVKEHIDEMTANLKRGSEIRWADPAAHTHFSQKMVEYHKNGGHDVDTCQCCMCKGKRGETKGKNNPMYGRVPHNKKPRGAKPCLYCGESFEYLIGGYNENQKFCSSLCSNRHKVLDKKDVIRNHKVVCVKVVKGDLDVYDLTVEKYHNFALTAGVFVHNTGKTRAAIWGMAAGMQRVMCLKNPWQFFKLASGGRMAVVFFNLTKTLSEGRGYRLLQNHLLASPWFRKRGIVKGKEPNQWLDIPLFEYKIASPYAKGFGTIGEDVLFAIMDEVDSPTESENQKVRVLQAYESTVRRFESRFVDNSYKESIGKFYLVASKQEQLSFLNAFVAERKNSPSVFIVDIPYWITRPEKNFSGKKFSVMIGDVYTPSKILCSLEEKKRARVDGCEIIEVPIEFLDPFERDIVGALKDIAGISISALRQSKLFPSEKIITACYDPEKKDPMSMTTIGIGLDDEIDLMNYIDLSKLRMPRSVPRYIHNDVAYSGDGDAMSLAMSGIKSWKKVNIEMPDGTFEVRRVPIIETDFVFRLKARPGDKIPLFRVRKFILDLALMGYIIKKYTADLSLLSEDTKQILTRRGIDCGYISLDRDIKPYFVFLDVVAEKRWICHRVDLLHFELVNLIHDKAKQKIDHPDKIPQVVFLKDGQTKEVILTGSKDMADGVAGSVYSALEDTGTLPVDAEIMANVLKIVQSVRSKERPKNWFLTRDAAYGKGAEQYVLHDSQGRFWHWVREVPGQTPRLAGPYTKKPLEIEVVDVDNPKSFTPGIVKKKESDDQASQFLDVLRRVRESR